MSLNQQTPGPCVLKHDKYIWGDDGTLITQVLGDHVDGSGAEANARLLAAAYNAFDKAGRTLNIDAATLADMVIDRLIERDGAL